MRERLISKRQSDGSSSSESVNINFSNLVSGSRLDTGPTPTATNKNTFSATVRIQKTVAVPNS